MMQEGNSTSPDSRRKLLILSLDGAGWEGLDVFRRQGMLPVIDSLLRQGSGGCLKAVLPTFTYPNWASFWTGRDPGAHGIYAFSDLSAAGALRPLADWDSLSIPNWLQYLSDRHKKIISIYAPLTSPPPSIQGIVLGDQHIFRTERFIYPPEISQELTARFPDLHVPRSEQYFPPEGFSEPAAISQFVDKQIASVEKTQELAEYLLNRQAWDVGLVHFFATDPLQHALWHCMDAGHPDFTKAGEREAARFFRSLDSAIGRLIEAVGPTAVLIFSVHGFAATRKVLNLTRLLWDEGIVRGLSLPERTRNKIFRISARFGLDRYLNITPEKKREIFSHPSWGPANILLDAKAVYVHKYKESDDGLTGRIIRALETVKDPETGSAVIQKAWRVEELYGSNRFRQWDAILLEFTKGYTGRNGDLSQPLLWGYQANKDYLIGTHTQEGIWLLTGDGPLPQRDQLISVLDLSAMILNYLEVPVPDWIEGKLPQMMIPEQDSKEVFSP